VRFQLFSYTFASDAGAADISGMKSCRFAGESFERCLVSWIAKLCWQDGKLSSGFVMAADRVSSSTAGHFSRYVRDTLCNLCHASRLFSLYLEKLSCPQQRKTETPRVHCSYTLSHIDARCYFQSVGTEALLGNFQCLTLTLTAKNHWLDTFTNDNNELA